MQGVPLPLYFQGTITFGYTHYSRAITIIISINFLFLTTLYQFKRIMTYIKTSPTSFDNSRVSLLNNMERSDWKLWGKDRNLFS